MLMYLTILILLINDAFSITEDEYFYNEKTPKQIYYSNNQRKSSYDVPPAPRYEVTEVVIDIPDDRAFGDVITNHTLGKPFNIASNTAPGNDKNKVNKIDKTPQENSNKNVNYHSLHKTENNEHSSKNIVQKIHKELIPNIEKIVHNAKESIAEIHNAVNEEFKNVNKELRIPSIVASPVLFLNKLQEKSTAAANKVHKTIFGDEFDDYDDDNDDF